MPHLIKAIEELHTSIDKSNQASHRLSTAMFLLAVITATLTAVQLLLAAGAFR